MINEREMYSSKTWGELDNFVTLQLIQRGKMEGGTSDMEIYGRFQVAWFRVENKLILAG